jgi:hypothetical protein
MNPLDTVLCQTNQVVTFWTLSCVRRIKFSHSGLSCVRTIQFTRFGLYPGSDEYSSHLLAYILGQINLDHNL